MGRKRKEVPVVQGIPTEANRDVLADLFDCSPRLIEMMAKEGIAVRIKPGLYDVRETARRYVKHLRDQAAGRKGKGDVDAVTEGALLKRTQRLMAEARLKQEMGLLASREDILAGWNMVVQATRAAVMGLPNAIAFRVPALTPHDRKVVEEVCKDVLTDLSEGKPPKEVKVDQL